MIFNKITLNDKSLFDKYIYPYKFKSCEYSFTTLYIWKDMCDVQFTVFKGTLIIKKKDFYNRYYFMQPLGYKSEELKEIIEELKKYKFENDMHYLFKDLDENFINEVRGIFNCNIEDYILEDRDNFDYLYEGKKLIDLSGKKMHKKKNHYNSFIKNYNYIIKSIDNDRVIDDVVYAAQKWYEENTNKDKILYYELSAIKDIINHMEELEIVGIAVYVDDKVVGFSIGQSMDNNLAIIHIEKADISYEGIYSFINKVFLEKYFNNIKIINREQDMGIEGLRKAKMSYYPFELEKKFILNICKC